MILMLAPAANMTFASMPSGSTYVSNSFGLIQIANNSAADQLALAAAGCETLTPLPGGTTTAQNGAAYAVQNADQNNQILFTNASPVGVTLPGAMPVGFMVALFQIGAGQVTASAGAGASVVTPNIAATPNQYSSLLCIVVTNTTGTNAQWDVIAGAIQSGGLIGATTLATLYSQDSSAHYAQYTIAQVFSDGTPANDGVWLKTGTGNGSGNWTQEASVTLAGLASQVASNTTNIAANTAALVVDGAVLSALQYTLSPNGTSALPNIDAGGGLWWLNFLLDKNRKVLRGQKNDGSIWAAQGGSSLVKIVAQVQSGGGVGITGITLVTASDAILPNVDAGGGLWWLNFVLDANRKIVFGQKSDGSFWEAQGGSALAQISGAAASAPTYSTDTNYVGPANPHTNGVYGTLTNAPSNASLLDMHIGIGQSWDQGENSAAFDATFTTAPLDGANCLMPNPGPVPWGSTITSFANLYEHSASPTIETWCSRAGHAIQSGFTTASVTGPKQLFAIAARGGTPYIGIKRGTLTYGQLLSYVSQCLTIAKNSGLTLRVRSIVMLHGQSDSTATLRDEYANDMVALRRDLDADIRTITGQSEPLRLITNQCCDETVTANGVDPNASLAQFDVMDIDQANCLTSHPAYCIGPQDNAGGPNAGGHWMAMGYVQIGEHVGHSILRGIYGAAHKPRRLLRAAQGAYWSSKSPYKIQLLYNGPVCIDTSNVVVDNTQLAAYGFEISDGSGSPPTISGVTQNAPITSVVISGSTVTIGTGNQGEAVVIVYSGVTYGINVDGLMTGTVIAAGFAAAIPGATAIGGVLTLPGAPTSALAYSNKLLVTLSAEPSSAPCLRYACQATGANGVGNQTGQRGVIRSPYSFALSAIARGNVTFGSNPTNGDTVTVNGVAITFVTSGATGNQVNIGGSAAATALALYTFLAAQTANASLNVARYAMDATGSVVLIYAGVATGLTLAKSSTAMTVLVPAAIPLYDWALAQRVDLPPI